MMAISAQQTKTHVAIAAWEWPSYFEPETKMRGITLDIAKWKRPSPESAPVHAKAAGLYMICTLSKHEAEKKGFQDALMLDYRGYVAEATGANVFFIDEEGTLHTPIPDCFSMASPARQCPACRVAADEGGRAASPARGYGRNEGILPHRYCR